MSVKPVVALTLLLAACTSGGQGSSSAGITGSASSSMPSISVSPAPSIAVGALRGTILFERAGGRFGDATIFTASADGTHERRITPFGAQCCARWSPDGTRILISALASDGKRITTGIIERDGSRERTIPLPDNTLNLGPGSWSPDGSRIAFEGWSDDRSGMRGIYVARASDGSGLVRVTHCSDLQDDRPMDFSPDGSEIYFFRASRSFPSIGDQREGSLFVVNTDGTNLRRVTPQDMPVEVLGNAGGKLSAEGRSIVFTSSGAIWTMHPDGSGLRKVFDEPQEGIPIMPTWSPDGSYILFVLDPTSALPVLTIAPPTGLYVIRVDGTGLTPLIVSQDFNVLPDWTAAQ